MISFSTPKTDAVFFHMPYVTEFLPFYNCLLYTSDAADDLLCVDLGGRRIIKKIPPK